MTTTATKEPSLERAREDALELGTRLWSAGEALRTSERTYLEFEASEACDPGLVRMVQDRALLAGKWIASIEGELHPTSEVHQALQELRAGTATGGLVASLCGLVGMACLAIILDTDSGRGDPSFDPRGVLGPLASWSSPIAMVADQAAQLGQALVAWADPTRPMLPDAGRGEVRGIPQ